LQTFLEILKANNIDVLVDLREKPCSRVKGFSIRKLEAALKEVAIKYEWMGKLLGGFTVSRESWLEGCETLAALARSHTVVMMCMEARSSQCHRKELGKILENDHGIVSTDL